MSKSVKYETDPNTPKRSAFSIFKEEFKKEFNNKNSDYKKLTSAAGQRWKLLSDFDKAPYVLKAKKLKGKMSVENDNEAKSEESDKSVADKSKSDKSVADKSKFDKLVPVKTECVVIGDNEEGSSSLKDNRDNIRTEIDEGEDELEAIITNFARFEEALAPNEPIAPPDATILHKHLDELEKLISLPLETLLESANLIQLRKILKLVKDLPLADSHFCKWCNTLLEVTSVMPLKRAYIQRLLMETEAKAQTMLSLQKEATDIRKTTLLELERKEECLTCIKRVDAKIESLKRQLVEAEADRATLVQLKGDLAVSKLQMLKRARIVRDNLAPLVDQNAAINNLILDSKNAIKNIDFHLNALIIQFVLLKNAVYDE